MSLVALDALPEHCIIFERCPQCDRGRGAVVDILVIGFASGFDDDLIAHMWINMRRIYSGLLIWLGR